jgi:predicted transcriptional regulator
VRHSIPIEESLWHSLRALAKKQRKKPVSLAEQAIREYLQRIDDEELQAESERQAQKAGISIGMAESAIRQRRIRARS